MVEVLTKHIGCALSTQRIYNGGVRSKKIWLWLIKICSIYIQWPIEEKIFHGFGSSNFTEYWKSAIYQPLELVEE